MVSCCMYKCGNSSNTCNYANKRITFHRFPIDPNIKEKWITITGRNNWFPTNNSRICSEHFTENDFNPTTQRRSLLKSAIPTTNIWKLYTAANSTDSMTSGPPVASTHPSTSYASSEHTLQSPDPSTSLAVDSDTPEEKKLKTIILINKDVIAKQRLMIKRLQCRTRRYKKKITEMKHLLKNLEDKRLITGDQAVSLKNMNITIYTI